MYVQWCIKGIAGLGHAEIDDVLRNGMLCNWWHRVGTIAVTDIPFKLTDATLDIHVNRYDDTDPATGRRYGEDTAFVSLAAGAVARRPILATNTAYSAHSTALAFATHNGRVDGWLIYCWVTVALNRAVPVEGVAEEVRELNTYRSWSAYQLEGEVTAKLRVPGTQVERCEWHHPDGTGGTKVVAVRTNPAFVDPSPVLNQRRWF